MDLIPYSSMVISQLKTALSPSDEQSAREFAKLAAAVGPAAELAIMKALSELAAEVTAELDEHVVEIRIDKDQFDADQTKVRVVVTRTEPEPDAGRRDTPPQDPGGDISRITLRMFDEIKSQAERAASSQGVSLNAWLSQTVQDALHGEWDRRRHGDRHERSRGGHRVRGWVQG